MNSCLGIILAGGRSSRMGHDKSALQRGNQSMLDYSKQVMTKAGVNNIIVSGNGYDIDDIYPQLGPIGGIASVLTQVACRTALIMPVDLPLMTSGTLAQLKLTGELSGSAVHYSDHPLPLYLPNNGFTELFFNKVLSGQLNSKGKAPSIKALLAQLPVQQLACKQPSDLTNTNTPEQWRTAQHQIAHQQHNNDRSA